MPSSLASCTFYSGSGKGDLMPVVFYKYFHAFSDTIINLQSFVETNWKLHGKPAMERALEKVLLLVLCGSLYILQLVSITIRC